MEEERSCGHMTAAIDLHIGRRARFGQLGTADGTFPNPSNQKAQRKSLESGHKA